MVSSHHATHPKGIDLAAPSTREYQSKDVIEDEIAPLAIGQELEDLCVAHWPLFLVHLEQY